MNNSVLTISVIDLAIAFVPVVTVLAILYRLSLDSRTALYSLARMVIQLLLIGYVLAYIFETDHSLIVIGVLAMMLLASSWIALRPVRANKPQLYLKVLGAITLGGVTTLLLVTQGVLHLQPWFWPRYVVPLAGMVFANSMNTVSLAAERFEAETNNKVEYHEARRRSLQASLIPLINSLFAVGIVSFPGMMTGQILSGVAPHIAARYQILVMCMLFGASGISAAYYLYTVKPKVDAS